MFIEVLIVADVVFLIDVFREFLLWKIELGVAGRVLVLVVGVLFAVFWFVRS